MATKECRVKMVDVLRGSSALAVAVFHFNEPYPALSDSYHLLLKWGWLGVTVFFVVSGFCISSARNKDGILTFWEKRLIRIYPPYWASLLVVAMVVAIRLATFGINDVAHLPAGPGAILYTLLALTAPASAAPNVNWVYWSLGYELAFYLLMGFLNPKKTALPVIGFSLLALSLSSFGYPFNQWGLFGLGVACHLFLENRWRSAVALAAICLGHVVVSLGVVQTMVGLLTALLIIWPPTLISSAIFKPLKRVGDFSYSLYLTHVPIGCYLIPHYLGSAFNRELVPSILQDLLLLAACIAFSYLFYITVENPTHKLARKANSPFSPAATNHNA